MKRRNNAIYIDLENIRTDIDIAKIFEKLILFDSGDEDIDNIFVRKLACGNLEVMKNFNRKLAEFNFEMQVTPKITQRFKNRADLIISLEALESIVMEKTPIERYIFVSSDSDFSVIMEKLRKYGKEIILITSSAASRNNALANSCDSILILDDFIAADAESGGEDVSAADNRTDDEFAEDVLKKVLGSLDSDRTHLVSFVGDKFVRLDKSRRIKTSSYKSLKNLIAKFEEDGLLKINRNEKGNPFIQDFTILC